MFQGSKVEAIIFNADIPKMSPLLRVYKKYKITNAEVKPIPAKFQTTELTIQWVISTKTVIQEINDDANEIMPVKFNYTKFTDLVHHMDDRNKSVDVLGVVIAALDRKTLNRNTKESNVQKFVLLDEECQTLFLSLWDDFLTNEGQQLLSNLHSYPVIIARRIKVKNYNDVALGTWFDSVILVDPPIQEALRNSKMIADVLDKRDYMKYNLAISLRVDQKATLICNVNPSQKITWVRARFYFEHIFQKYWYMSCKNCYRATAADYKVEFTCNSCKEKQLAVPRCCFDVDLVDDSGAIPASIFGELAEKLLTFTSIEATQHFNENVELPLDLVHEQLKSKTFLIHIKPVQAQLADARQRYTVIYYYEVDHATSSAQVVSETKNDLPLLNDQSPTLELADTEQNLAPSKTRMRLSEKFDELDKLNAGNSPDEPTSSTKKSKLT
ncbi:replication protein A 70 kDa DNA-binding subunit D-like [Coffea arabica]|uniref:Replication protein A 70 kDa DNA-binding subunit D-like n=1 Tax=Coffea arabica TaxID=13443 RepID=A0A6P6XNT0_COFAR|nr:replication protein A 70 kDa DNA-binding subunit D-like [Coffea arabica]